jgi:hypothetical protein
LTNGSLLCLYVLLAFNNSMKSGKKPVKSKSGGGSAPGLLPSRAHRKQPGKGKPAAKAHAPPRASEPEEEEEVEVGDEDLAFFDEHQAFASNFLSG